MTWFFSSLASLVVFACSLVGVLRTVHAQRCGRSQRRAWRDLSCREQDEYLRGLQMLKDQGIYDELTDVHWDSRDEAHEVDAFLPWHRWFMWVFERELQRVTGTCITAPYWDWERDRGALDVVLKSSTFGRRNRGGCVTDGVAANWNTAEDNRCLWRTFNDDFDFSRSVELLWRIEDNPDFVDFNEAIEGSPHSSPHYYIGGSMGVHWSPDDPLFYLHHSNIDRIWALWQDYHGHDEINNINNYDWEHYSGRDIDTPMSFWGERRINFNDPSTGRSPTPRAVLNMVNGIVDVQYVNDGMARELAATAPRYRNGGNNRRWLSPATGGVGERCSRENDQRPTCRAPAEPCQRRDQCCSGRCGTRGRCGRPLNRHLFTAPKDTAPNDKTPMEDNEALPFSSDPKLQARWLELLEMYPEDPGRVLETLAREDCAARDKAAHHEIRSASQEYIEMVSRVNNTHVFDCHFVRVH